ncbi:uncharacterized protein BDV17DRAFT_269059 [Aspergillus undulatus]|uniref:uncharacterized protein n=1 Tax=Aspergillus undulatus TaxID=1810928 RepID=UPI003CCD22E4
MASNRVERLQMRQRGAGTRKIKEVDFGFSLGFGPSAEESSQPASQPASQPTNNELQQAPVSQPLSLEPPAPVPKPTTTEPPQTQPSLSPIRSNANAVALNQSVQRTPGSARNKLPPRPSTFDIPAEDEPELERSSKRRRIGPPGDISPLIDAQSEPHATGASQNGTVEEQITPLQREGKAIPIRTSSSNQVPTPDQEPPTGPPAEPPAKPPSIPINETNNSTVEAPEAVESLETGPTDQSAVQLPRANGTAPASDTTAGKGKGRRKGRPSPSQSDRSNEGSNEPVEAQPTETAQPPDSIEAPHEPKSVEPELTETREKRSRGRTPASVPPSDKPLPTDQARTDKAGSEPVSGATSGKGVRGRKKKDSKLPEVIATREQISESNAELVEADVASDDIAAHEDSNLSQEQPSDIDKGKKRTGRHKKQASRSPEDSEEPDLGKRKKQRDEQVEANAEQGQVETDGPRTAKRRKQRAEREPSPRPDEQAVLEPELERRRAGRKRGEEPEPMLQDQHQPETETQTSRAGRRKLGEQQQTTELKEQFELRPNVEETRTKRGQKRRERPPSAKQDEQPEQHEPQPDVEEVRTKRGRKRREEQPPTAERDEQPEQLEQLEQPRQREPHPEVGEARTKRGRKRREERPPTPEQDKKPEREAETELELQPESQPERERAKTTERGQGKRSTTQADETAQDDTAESQPRPAKRKRQPRGETVPITVHRLANAASLGGELQQSDSEDEDESPEEISSKQTTKLPSRGGVNAADVLAQICRETLEKTLTTLKNGIANEANTARRAEWTLRRKAVEAFGSELEGRLFDLSEILDSNFMLSHKVKKAKRNMMDLRTRLDRVRKEREAVALKMDAVRREHAKEEQAGMARSTINHSLHNLDLALERGQGRASEDERLTAGLEFRLRNAARNVSSMASGAQGGLLDQIKAFNAQLERQLKE